MKDTLTSIYKSGTADDPPPEYLLIIGDVNRIPKADETSNISDMYYGEFDGAGDYIPEMFIGRIPVSDTNDVKAVVNKIIQYEKFQFADTNKFYQRALITAGNDITYAINMNGQLNYALNNYLKSSNKIEEHHFYYPQSALLTVEDSIKKLFRTGISFINYTGHGDATGWLDPAIKSKDVDSLKNRNMYPFIISNACRTAQYSSSGAFGNRMVLSKDKGSVGFIGCSNDSYWDEDYFWAVGAGTVSLEPTYITTGLGAYDRLFHLNGESPADWYFTMGQINYAGNLAVSASTSTRKKYYWETYNLIGDPSVIPIIGTPGVFTYAIPDTLPNGIKSLTVNADPFSYIAVSHSDTLWDASYASASGSAELTMPGLSNDSCLMVITGQNKIPRIKTIKFSNVKGEYLNLTSSSINDIDGNNNKRVDFGESFFLNLTVSNLGSADATGVYAKISSASSLLTVNSDSVYIGTLRARSEKIMPDNLKMTIAGDIEDMGIVTIDLLLKDSRTTKHYKIDICIHAPDLAIANCVMNDTLEGNKNNVADPGETFYLIFKVMNRGSSNVAGQFYVTSNSSDLTILEPNVKSGDLKFGETTDVRVKVKLAESASAGNFISLGSLLDCTPYILNKEFTFRVGRIRESFESLSFNVFPWINISPIPWVITETNPFEGVVSARSGQISHSDKTSLVIRSRFEKDDSLKFNYRVSSEVNYDNLSFKLNDTEIFNQSGEIPWTKISVPVPAGINKMEWSYSKDQSVSNGADCAWLDLIDFAESGAVSYIEKDLQVARIVTPIQKDRYGKETVTIKVLNIGKDPINGFNLAYRVNDIGSPVRQTFNNVIMPWSDSVTVSFSSRADLSRYGAYNLTAYAYDNNDDYLSNDTLQVYLENHQVNDSLSVYPNPFTNQFSLYVQSANDDYLKISVINNTGTKFYEFERSVIPGMNTIIISDLKLPPAIYYLKISGSTIDRVIPVVRLR
ncbi:MAG: T9SS type A sorting domain-containing protein [Bacteroidales bacterium]|nr:T9SS type A sorting domain-containing protein [Bacteroidales bacterium]